MQGQSQAGDATDPGAKEERGRSAMDFTYSDLADSEELSQTVHSIGGTGCSSKALAGKMNQSAEGGGFRMKLYSARTFGLLSLTRGHVELTNLGLRIIDPKHQKAARVEAFLRVPLYAKLFRDLDGKLLPPLAAIDRMVLQAGVAPKQKERARQVFLRSAKHAGFFDINPDRLLQPQNSDTGYVAAEGPAAPQEPSRHEGERRQQQRFQTGGGDGGDGGIHPALLWLLRELPAPGTAMAPRRKEQLKAAFATNLDFIYPDPEDIS